MVIRYSHWDGTQNVNPFDADDLLEAISDDVIRDGDLRRALERIMKRGADLRNGRMPGMRDMMERLRQMRQQELSRYDMGSVLDDIQQKLDEIVAQERAGIQKRLDDALNRNDEESGSREVGKSGSDEKDTQDSGLRTQDSREAPDDSLRRMLENIANRKNRYLDDMPNDPGGKIKALQDYEFMDPQARQMFQDLMSQLQQRMLGNTFQGLMDSLKSMTPEDMAGLREMVKDLN